MPEVNVLEAASASQNNSNSNQLEGHSPKSIPGANTRGSQHQGEARWGEASRTGEEARTLTLYSLMTLFFMILLSLKSFSSQY